MVTKEITIDFKITNKSLYEILEKAFSFPSWWGKNGDAAIDCLLGMRTPWEHMSSIELGKEEQLLIHRLVARNLSKEVIEFLEIVASVNYKVKLFDCYPSILVSLEEVIGEA